MKELSFPGNASSLLIMKSKHFNPHDTTFQDFKKETSLNPFKKSKSKKKKDFLRIPPFTLPSARRIVGLSERTNQGRAASNPPIRGQRARRHVSLGFLRDSGLCGTLFLWKGFHGILARAELRRPRPKWPPKGRESTGRGGAGATSPTTGQG